MYHIFFLGGQFKLNIICKAHVIRIRIQLVVMKPCTTNMNTNIICKLNSQLNLNIQIHSNIWLYHVFHVKYVFLHFTTVSPL